MNLLIPTLFLTALSLAGCATDGTVNTVHDTSTRVVDGTTEVGIKCLKPGQIPVVPPVTTIVAKATAKQKAAAIGADIKGGDEYIIAADPLLHQCSTQ